MNSKFDSLSLSPKELAHTLTKSKAIPCVHFHVTENHICEGTVRPPVIGKYTENILKLMGTSATESLGLKSSKELRGLLSASSKEDPGKKQYFKCYYDFAQYLDKYSLKRNAYCCFDDCPHFFLGFGDHRTAKKHIWAHIKENISTVNNSNLLNFFSVFSQTCPYCRDSIYKDGSKDHLAKCHSYKSREKYKISKRSQASHDASAFSSLLSSSSSSPSPVLSLQSPPLSFNMSETKHDNSLSRSLSRPINYRLIESDCNNYQQKSYPFLSINSLKSFQNYLADLNLYNLEIPVPITQSSVGTLPPPTSPKEAESHEQLTDLEPSAESFSSLSQSSTSSKSSLGSDSLTLDIFGENNELVTIYYDIKKNLDSINTVVNVTDDGYGSTRSPQEPPNTPISQDFAGTDGKDYMSLYLNKAMHKPPTSFAPYPPLSSHSGEVNMERTAYTPESQYYQQVSPEYKYSELQLQDIENYYSAISPNGVLTSEYSFLKWSSCFGLE